VKVLIAIDGSEHSDYAIEETIKFAWSADCEFKVVTILDNSFVQSAANEGPTASAQKLVDSAIEKLSAGLPSGQPISGQVLHGYPKSEIVKCAEDWPANVIVMGSRGRKGLKRIVLGSVSHSVLVASNCSVRISRNSGVTNSEVQKIIIGLDDSPISDTIIERMASRPWKKNVEFICLTAIPTLTQYFYGVQDSHEIDSLESLHNEKIKRAKEHLEQISKTIQSKIPQCSVSFEVLEGDPREVIVDKAKETNAALIIVGHKGKNWMDRLLIGSVSEAIATWAGCSVLVVK
jgi:uncharacterized protein